jgi:hypothetical protein
MNTPLARHPALAALLGPPHALVKRAFLALCLIALASGAARIARGVPAALEDMRLQAMPAASVGVSRSPLPHPETLGPFRVRKRLALAAPDARFGGISGLAWRGDHLIAVSDRGFFLQFAPDLAQVRIGPLRDTQGRPMRLGDNDSEDVALLPDGRLAISFEGDHRVWLYSPAPLTQTRAEAGPTRTAAMRTLRGNGGLEALCAGPDGTLLAGEEGPFMDRGPHRVWLAAPGAAVWERAFGIVAQPGWGLTACKVLPSGDLLTLERFWRPGAPFQARIGRVRSPFGAQDREPEPLALLGPAEDVGNLEGVAQRKEPDGALTLWLVSDNNYGDQPTELWELQLPAGAP